VYKYRQYVTDQLVLQVNAPGTWLVADTDEGPVLLFDLVKYRRHQTIHVSDVDATAYTDDDDLVTSDGHHVLLSITGPPPRYKAKEGKLYVPHFATWDVRKGENRLFSHTDFFHS
jgi:hypothetical protein